jgi:hypothetical protein
LGLYGLLALLGALLIHCLFVNVLFFFNALLYHQYGLCGFPWILLIPSPFVNMRAESTVVHAGHVQTHSMQHP